jgi:hypothetical protein
MRQHTERVIRSLITQQHAWADPRRCLERPRAACSQARLGVGMGVECQSLLKKHLKQGWHAGWPTTAPHLGAPLETVAESS